MCQKYRVNDLKITNLAFKVKCFKIYFSLIKKIFGFVNQNKPNTTPRIYAIASSIYIVFIITH